MNPPRPGTKYPPAKSDRKRPGQEPAARGMFSSSAIREIVESVVVAFVLAFLFRTFEAEAFVIPTGSMAPTLMGRHRDVTCPKCGYPFQVSASEEVTEAGAPRGEQVISGTCPMCRFTMNMTPGRAVDQAGTSFKGDRILVGKFPYHLGDPQRWDVAVFRFPGKARTNYIKRIAGLPNETFRIQYGDVWVKPEGQQEFSIARKPPEKILAMMQPVYDNDYVLPGSARKGLPLRWAAVRSDAAGAWQPSQDLKSFRTEGSSREEAWLTYQHVVPNYEYWAHLVGLNGVEPAGRLRPQLISDFTAYNMEEKWYMGKPGDRAAPPMPPSLPDELGLPIDARKHGAQLGLHWVGDLVVQCEVNAESGSGELRLELIKGGVPFRCSLDLAKGSVELSIPGVGGFQANSAQGIRGPGRHQLRFANVDDQLLVWIDGKVVKFDSPTTYDSRQIDTAVPNREDLQPVRIGSRGAAAEVRHLKIYRDLYYIAQRARGPDDDSQSGTDFDSRRPDFPYPYQELSMARVADFLASPEEWEAFRHRRRVDFPLGPNEYIALGDNSAASKDSRLWEDERTPFFVHRDLLIGKAFFIYWPHSWDRIPGTGIPFPMFPNFARMGPVR